MCGSQEEVLLHRWPHLFLSAYMPGSFIITILLVSKLTIRKFNWLTCPQSEIWTQAGWHRQAWHLHHAPKCIVQVYINIKFINNTISWRNYACMDGNPQGYSHVRADQWWDWRSVHAVWSQLHVRHHIGSLKWTMVRIYTTENSKHYTSGLPSSQLPPPTPEPALNYLPAYQCLKLLICWTTLLSYNVPCQRKQWSGKSTESGKASIFNLCLTA